MDAVPGLIKGASVLVTGGAGFIGSNIAELLSRDGSNRVLVVDDLSCGSLSNLAWMEGRDNVSFQRLDVCETERLRRLMGDVEVVFHEAAIASVQASVERPAETNRVNVGGTLSCLEASLGGDVRSFVFASSCAVYGDQAELPLRENLPERPISPYGASKAASEQYVRVFHVLHGLHAVSLRYFNVYGPRQNPSSQYAAVVPRFIERMGSGKPPVIYGDGEQTRDFTYVVDVARANCLAAMERSAAGGTYNVAFGSPVSINRLVEALNETMGTRLGPVYESARRGDIRQSWADISLIREELGFEPLYPLERGLQETVSYYESGR